MTGNLITPKTKEQVLMYLAGRKEGYAREISAYYSVSLSPVQNQLNQLENSGVIYSRQAGKTIIYRLNERYPFYKELKNLLEKMLSFLPEEEKKKLLFARKRPRRKGKPL